MSGMSTRRVVAFGALVLAALGAWAPVAHADVPTGRWTDPAPNGQQATVTRAQQLKGSADFGPSSIEKVDFSVLPDGMGAPTGQPCSADGVVRPQTRTGSGTHIDFAFDAPFPCNRKYHVRAAVTPKARPLQSDSPLYLDLWVSVAIPSAATSGLAATADSGERAVQLTWAGAPREADFEGFQIRRAKGDGGFAPIADAEPGATSWTDRDVARGETYRYQVVGMRPGPDPGTTVFSPAGPTASATLDAEPSSGGDEEVAPVDSNGDGTIDETEKATAAEQTRTLRSGSGVPTGNGVSSVHREIASGSRTPTTLDTGYSDRLPFKTGQPGADGAVAELLDGGDGGDDRQRALLIGGGTVTFSWAMLLRFLSRRAALLY
jgi:hypothetical protein